jgi:hypothetical protein
VDGQKLAADELEIPLTNFFKGNALTGWDEKIAKKTTVDYITEFMEKENISVEARELFRDIWGTVQKHDSTIYKTCKNRVTAALVETVMSSPVVTGGVIETPETQATEMQVVEMRTGLKQTAAAATAKPKSKNAAKLPDFLEFVVQRVDMLAAGIIQVLDLNMKVHASRYAGMMA